MKILENMFEPERILTYIDACTISLPYESNHLKQIAQLERKKVEIEYARLVRNNRQPKNITQRDYIIQRLLEKRNYSKDYNDMSVLRKEIIYANAILPSDTEIADLLTNKGYTIEHLKEVMRVRKYFLDIIKYQDITMSDALKQQIEIYQDYITTLFSLFKEKFGVSDSTIILNRICEMLVTCPSFFESKQQKNSILR